MGNKKIYGVLCRVEGCGKPRYRRRSVCGMHHTRLSRYKSLEVPVFNYPEGIVHECKIHGLLPDEKSYKNPRYGHYSCLQCRRDSDRKFIENHPEKDLNAYKQYYYVGSNKKIKITKALYERMFNAQGGVCAICKKEETSIHPTKKHGNKTRRLAIDHCHKTGKIRGLLCQKHNQGIGYFEDSIETLKSAISYLESHQ